jgi:hypothetical protein
MVRKLLPCLLLGYLLIFLAACSPVPDIPVQYDPNTLVFSGERAYEIEEQFVTTYTGRVSGTEQSRKAAEWLQAEFSNRGWNCAVDTWDTVNYSRPVTYRNVVCRLPGMDPREILVVAHHDMASTTVQGADNDGSGIAILLHLAEIFAAEDTRPYSLVFVATDAEEYGMVGSRRFTETNPNNENIIAGISLDNLGRDYYDKMIIEQSGQFHNSDYGPVWVALVSQEAADAADGLWPVVIKDPVTQMLEQAVPISFTDQGPLNAARIPSIGFGAGYPSEYGDLHYSLWHEPGDNMEHESPISLGQSGALAEAWVRQLMAMDQFPDTWGPFLYFESSKSTLRGAPLYLIFIAIVALFYIPSYFAGKRSLAQKFEGWRRALPHYLGLWLPLVAGLLLLYFFVQVGIMVKYYAYPATTKDPAMLTPDWLPIILFLLGLGIFFGIGRWLVRRFTAASPQPDFGSIKSLAFLIIGLMGTYVVIVNPFALLFFLPLFFWLLIRGRQGAGRLLDVLFFLLGGLMIYALIYYFGFIILRYGIVFLWYFLNAIAIQMFSFSTVLGGFAVLAAGLSLVVPPPRTAQPQVQIARDTLETRPVGG